MAKIEMDIECKNCSGTGLYDGMGEGPGAAVVCTTCKGTGCQKYSFEYEEFKHSKYPSGVKWVYEVNPGIKVGNGGGHKFSDFGGMSYDQWGKGLPFPKGSENRLYTCPAWWYQSADYSKRPEWKECGWGSFSNCDSFKNKSECWKRFDAEQGA